MLCRLPPFDRLQVELGRLDDGMGLPLIKVGHVLVFVGKRTGLQVGSEIWSLQTSNGSCWMFSISTMEISAIIKPNRDRTLASMRDSRVIKSSPLSVELW